MAQPESNFKNMFLALFTVTFVAAAILGLVNERTKAAIARADIEQQNLAIAAILPPFTYLGKSYKSLPKDEKDSLQFFPAFGKDSALVGTAVKTYSKKGFSGLVTIMVGFTTEGNISGFRVLEHKETPGLGSRMYNWFSDKNKPKQNVIGTNPDKSNFMVMKDGGSFDAITAATISSRAFLESIRRAYDTWKSEKALNAPTTVKAGPTKKGGTL
ncbi:MAG TPA: RnfABCDGE type electron transport complex subunit G [Prolixibacteraceae bacterium]